MGGGLSKIWELLSNLFQAPEYVILMVGLDNAGKTTILQRLATNQAGPTAPTIGFNLEKIDVGNAVLRVWDAGGSTKVIESWKEYYTQANGIVFVVDSADKARFARAREVLFDLLLSSPDHNHRVVLIVANKMDKPDAASRDEVWKSIGPKEESPFRWGVMQTNAYSGEGLDDAIKWISREIGDQ